MWQQSRNCISWFCRKVRLCPRAGIDISLYDLSCAYQDEHRTTESNSVARPCDVVRVKMSNDLLFCECLIFVWFKKFLNCGYYWILTSAPIKVIPVNRMLWWRYCKLEDLLASRGGEQLSNNVTSLQRLRMVYDMRNNVFQRRSIETSKIFLRWYGQDPNTWFRQHQNVYLSMS